MARSLSYSDAVKLLGGDGRIVTTIDNVLGGALLAATTVSPNFILALFDAKGELARVSGELVKNLRDKVNGLGRFDRTQRLEAAHTIIALTAFFEAVADAGLPDLGLDRSEQLALAAGEAAGSNILKAATRGILHLDVPGVAPHRPYEESIRRLRDYYGGLSGYLADFLPGLALWDSVDETGRVRLIRILSHDVPDRAVRGYEESLRRLAAEFPEVAFWINLTDHQATRNELRSGLAGLERLIADIRTGRVPDERRTALAREYRAELKRSVLRSGDVPDGLRIPSLGEAYIDHRFRVSGLGQTARPDHEGWWGDRPVRVDLYEYLAGHLTSPDAVQRPLLLLGQPGSGKSVLTKILAARLPASDFLVVRVVLREVPADTDVQTQIEHAVRAATGERLTWTDLARSADGALPVVLLDGFDELLQATGVSQSDYLEKLVRFQEREADQGRPVAVLVTSRTAVADRVRVPAEGAVAVRLEPFDGEQVGRWLEVWNDTNAAYFAERGLRPLPPAVAPRELAEQPLLLMMLALYDADGNALQRESGRLDRAELYERLLTRFAEREVAKSGASLDERQQRRAVEEEFLRLSVTAFAMFNRGRQWVTEDELNADLKALLGDDGGTTGTYAPLTSAQTVVGRFFFVHQAQALRGQVRLTTCEFLHATFGEYLIARLTADELARLADDAARGSGRARQATPDDGFLHALLSFAPLTIRRPTVDFLQSMVKPHRDSVSELLLTYFRTALDSRAHDRHTEYAPIRLSVPARHATYAANLVTLLAVAGDPITASALFPAAAFPLKDWHALALLWRSQLTDEAFFSLAETLRLERVWHQNEERDLHVTIGTPVLYSADPAWLSGGPAGFMNFEEIQLETLFTCGVPSATLLHAAEDLGPLVGMFTVLPETGASPSAAHLLTRLLALTASPETPDADLVGCYVDCLKAAAAWKNVSVFRMIFRQLALDAERLPREWLMQVATHFGETVRSDQQLTAYAKRAFTGLGLPLASLADGP
ncbi:NACHT domain-containing protein [Actinoallomurus sp. CA-150999]|uniref:NACHT domain-containing protein n=1 Tax=Actinoallomurus sp. CA-150999 TaxID=3239887 RepID=UPI003D9401B3